MDRKLGRRRYLKSGVIAAGVSSFAGCLGGGGTEDGSGGGGGGSGDGSGGTVGQGGDGDAGPVTWKFATTNPGTPALSWVNAFAKIVEENTDRLEIEPFTAESFLGALVAVNDGDATLGISDFFAWNALRDGTHPFEEPTPEEGLPRATIPPLHNSGFWLAARASKDIKTLQDLDGVDFSLWDKGSDFNLLIEDILAEAGIELGAVERTSAGDTATSVREGRVDGWTMFIINNYINPGPEAELANQVDHWSIPVPDDIKETVLGKRKGWETIQVGTDTMNIPFQNEPADVFFRASNVFADPDADPEVVQLFTSIMLENQDAIHEIHPGLRMFGFGPAGENVPYDELWGFTGTDENTLFHEGAINHFEAEDIDYPSA